MIVASGIYNNLKIKLDVCSQNMVVTILVMAKLV